MDSLAVSWQNVVYLALRLYHFYIYFNDNVVWVLKKLKSGEVILHLLKSKDRRESIVFVAHWWKLTITWYQQKTRVRPTLLLSLNKSSSVGRLRPRFSLCQQHYACHLQNASSSLEEKDGIAQRILLRLLPKKASRYVNNPRLSLRCLSHIDFDKKKRTYWDSQLIMSIINKPARIY